MKSHFKVPETSKVVVILIIFYSVGIAGLTLPATKEYIEILTPYTLIMNLVLLMVYHSPWSAKHLFLFGFIALAGFFVEVAGVSTGLVFGEYQYKNILGLTLFDTPLIIGINWLMLIYFVYHLTGLTGFSPVIKIVTGSLLMVVYDIILEPVAIRMNMWTWRGGDIPLQNYAAWFIISFLFLSLLHAFRIKVSNRMAAALFAIQAGFILTLNIIYRIV